MAVPKTGVRFKLEMAEKRGFEDPGAIIEAMVACWDDLTSSFQTLDSDGRDTVVKYVDDQTGESVCECLFGDNSDSFREKVSCLDKPLQVKFLTALVEVEILDPQSIGVEC